jgi:hypothetical protein
MRQPVRALLSLCVLSQLFFACKKDNEGVTLSEATSDSGYFVVSSTGAANGRIAASVPTSHEFDYGPLLASDNFLFLIANGGDQPIFDVTLTSDNLPFDVSPSYIGKLPGKKETTIYPLLNVGVTHGVRLKGVGTAPLLPKGENKAIIRMKGKTLSGRDTIQVTGQFILKVNAMVVDAKLLSGGIEALSVINEYTTLKDWLVEPAKRVHLINSGSVPIRATISYWKYLKRIGGPMDGDTYSSEVFKNEFELLANESKDITNMISPIEKYEEDGTDWMDYYYSGRSGIEIKPIKEEGVIVKVDRLYLISK